MPTRSPEAAGRTNVMTAMIEKRQQGRTRLMP